MYCPCPIGEQKPIFHRLDTPKFSLYLELQCSKGPTIAKEGPNNLVIFHITREVNDDHEEPCSIYWTGSDAFGSQGLLLLRHTAEGRLEKVEGLVKPEHEQFLSERGFWNYPHQQSFLELKPGQTTWFGSGVPKQWLEALIPGQQYELVWPGGEIPWWGWGTIEENFEKRLDPSARAVIYGSSHLSISVTEKVPPPVYKTPRPQWPATPAYVTIMPLLLEQYTNYVNDLVQGPRSYPRN